MFKVYNKRAVTRQQRFQNALVFGIAATIVITLAYGLLSYLLHVELSVVYLAAGYAIGYVIQKYGRGVQAQFSILAAVLAGCCFIFGDMISIAGFNVALWPFALQLALGNLLSAGSIISLLFRIGGVLIAYQTARVI